MSFLENWFGGKKADEKVSPVVLNKILDAMRESVLIVGEDTRILSSNRAAYEAFGRKNGAIDGKRLSEVVRDLNLHEAFRRALVDNLSSDIELEIPGVEKRRYDAHVAPIEIDEIKGAIGIFYDITQIEIAVRRQKRRANRRLRQRHLRADRLYEGSGFYQTQ